MIKDPDDMNSVYGDIKGVCFDGNTINPDMNSVNLFAESVNLVTDVVNPGVNS